MKMHIMYFPELIEGVVMGEMHRRESHGDSSLLNLYHRKAEPLYELGIEDRANGFGKLHAEFFSTLGFEKLVRQIIEEFPQLDKVAGAFLVQAETDEEADIAVEEGRPRLILIKLHPESFLDPARLSRSLRHELMHVSDMLAEDFGYRVESLSNSMVEEMVVRDRYRLLWDIHVDSSLSRRGAVGQEERDQRFAEFEHLYQKIPKQHREAVFEVLWSAEKMTHSELLVLASEPGKLLEKAGVALEKKTLLLPGMPCPLCKFPTYSWLEDMESADDKVIKAIQEDFPGWSPGNGACERCIEVYHAHAYQI